MKSLLDLLQRTDEHHKNEKNEYTILLQGSSITERKKDLEKLTKLDHTPLPPQAGYLEQKEAIEKSGGGDSEKHKELVEKKSDPVRYKGLEKEVGESMRLVDKFYADMIESRRETKSLYRKLEQCTQNDARLENSEINSSISTDNSMDTRYDAYQLCENGIGGKSNNPPTNTSELDIGRSDLAPKMEEIQRRQMPHITTETRKSKNASDISSLKDSTSDENIRKEENSNLDLNNTMSKSVSNL